MPGPRSQIAAILSSALVRETLILNNERCNRYCQIRCVRKVNSGTGPITRKPGPGLPSVHVDGELFQDPERDDRQCFRMGALQYDPRGPVNQVGLQPSLGTQAPTVVGIQAGKTELRPRSAQVVTALPAELQKLVGDNTANRVSPVVV